MTLRAMGGRRPLTFLVDGRPLAADPARREVAWLPPGPGFYRVTVLDAEGSSVRAEVRVKNIASSWDRGGQERGTLRP